VFNGLMYVQSAYDLWVIFSKISKCKLLEFIFKRKREQYSFLGFLYYHFSIKKQQNKINNIEVNVVTKTTIFINAENT